MVRTFRQGLLRRDRKDGRRPRELKDIYKQEDRSQDLQGERKERTCCRFGEFDENVKMVKFRYTPWC